ncbi:MAG: ABC transporter permease subunit [Bacillaceae bacterium]
MLRLIKAEIYKLFKVRTLRVLCIIAALMGVFLVGTTFILKDQFEKIPDDQREMIMEQLSGPTDSSSPIISAQFGYSLSAVKDPLNPAASELFYSSFGSGLLPVFMAILVAALVAKEYSSGTIKNSIAYGNKREYYYLSKFVSLTVGSIIISLVMIIVPTVLATFIYGWGADFTLSSFLAMIGNFGAFMIVNMALVALLLLLASILKSNGATIGFGIALLVFAPMLLSGLYGQYDWYDRLFKLTPFYQAAVVQTPGIDTVLIVKSIVISIITAVIALVCGTIIFRKQDIK